MCVLMDLPISSQPPSFRLFLPQFIKTMRRVMGQPLSEFPAVVRLPLSLLAYTLMNILILYGGTCFGLLSWERCLYVRLLQLVHNYIEIPSLWHTNVHTYTTHTHTHTHTPTHTHTHTRTHHTVFEGCLFLRTCCHYHLACRLLAVAMATKWKAETERRLVAASLHENSRISCLHIHSLNTV